MPDTPQIGTSRGGQSSSGETGGGIFAVADLDGRTRAAKRTKELITTFTAAFGGAVESHQRVAIQRAAELVAIAEQTRALHLAGKATANDVVRTDGAAARAVKALKLPSRPINRQSFAERLAASGGRPVDDRSAGCASGASADERIAGLAAQPAGAS